MTTTTATNLIVGNSKTVHNGLARMMREGEWASVPTCSVGTHGKTLVATTEAVTCKTCAKATR